jgi:hypothetical protein
MKIECKIKRAGGTIVDMPNEGAADTRYHFQPVDPSRADSPHVAEVANDDHAQRFLAADPTVYRIFSAKPAPNLAPPAPPAAPPVPPATTPATGEAGENSGASGDGSQGDGAGGEEAPEMTIKDLRAGIASKTLTPERLRELLDHEQTREKPRNSFIAEIMAALK